MNHAANVRALPAPPTPEQLRQDVRDYAFAPLDQSTRIMAMQYLDKDALDMQTNIDLLQALYECIRDNLKKKCPPSLPAFLNALNASNYVDTEYFPAEMRALISGHEALTFLAETLDETMGAHRTTVNEKKDGWQQRNPRPERPERNEDGTIPMSAYKTFFKKQTTYREAFRSEEASVLNHLSIGLTLIEGLHRDVLRIAHQAEPIINRAQRTQRIAGGRSARMKAINSPNGR